MTPTYRLLARYLPAKLVLPALSIVYALLLVGIIMAIGRQPANIFYLDVLAP
ncbi:MAG: hypothetical protein J0I86_08200 [Mesorhizobium sp.]|nr:hypothetical protein [Mesorhizobium sp.]